MNVICDEFKGYISFTVISVPVEDIVIISLVRAFPSNSQALRVSVIRTPSSYDYPAVRIEHGLRPSVKIIHELPCWQSKT